jgi:catechol 2,3-dioxygenase-like lactoylglutathione lyase family enzyme
MVATVLGSPDPATLAAFYERFLGWVRVTDKPNWVTIRPRSGGPGLSFQMEPNHVPPTLPTVAGEQQIIMHLDIAVADLDRGVAWAIEAGARLAKFQPQERLRVMLDPAGHPFCLFGGQFDSGSPGNIPSALPYVEGI